MNCSWIPDTENAHLLVDVETHQFEIQPNVELAALAKELSGALKALLIDGARRIEISYEGEMQRPQTGDVRIGTFHILASRPAKNDH